MPLPGGGLLACSLRDALFEANVFTPTAILRTDFYTLIPGWPPRLEVSGSFGARNSRQPLSCTNEKYIPSPCVTEGWAQGMAATTQGRSKENHSLAYKNWLRPNALVLWTG